MVGLCRGLLLVSASAALMVWPGPGRAQDAPAPSVSPPPAPANAPEGPAPGGAPPGPDAPTQKPQLRAFCTDRPTKANAACTVDAGHFQLETDAFNASFDHQDGVDTDTYLYTNPTLKYGLTDTTDLEVNWAPYETVRTHDVRSGETDTVSGVGDLYLRAKIALTGDTGDASFAAALFPYVKAPTARAGIGDGAWEGGVIVPLVFTLSKSVSLTFDPEVDLLKNTVGDGRHASMNQLVGLSWSLPQGVTLLGEFWSDVNFDPTGTVTQYSADLAATYGLPHDLQLDVGLNLGLNRATPAVQVYTGVSHRF